MSACTCGHLRDQHDNDPEYPGSTSCQACGCIAYEAGEDDDELDEDPDFDEGDFDDDFDSDEDDPEDDFEEDSGERDDE